MISFFYRCDQEFNLFLDGDTFKREIDRVEVIINKVLLWECTDQCQYECMWKTVDAFKGRNWEIPQFFGKVSLKIELFYHEPYFIITL